MLNGVRLNKTNRHTDTEREQDLAGPMSPIAGLYGNRTRINSGHVWKTSQL